jgi:hypothetical protein
MLVRMEKSDWERVSPDTVGTGRGCVSDDSDEISEEVKVELSKAGLMCCRLTKPSVNLRCFPQFGEERGQVTSGLWSD